MGALAYVLLLAIVSLEIPLGLSLASRVNSEVRSQALGQADVIAASAADLLASSQRPALQQLAASASTQVRGRVLIVGGNGNVLADSSGSAQLGRSYAGAGRPEIASALAGHRVQAERDSTTLGQRILATAVPVIRRRMPIGVVRITQSVAAVRHAVFSSVAGLALIGGVVLALGLIAGALIARQVARPLHQLERTVSRVARGDLRARAVVEGSREQRSLSQSFNEMTARIARLVRSQREFVADASHQLRTPLTGLRLRVEEARAAGVSPAAARELDAGVAEIDRLSQIVDELMVLSRAGERELPGEALALSGVVDSALGRWRPSANERGMALEDASTVNGGSVWSARPDVDRALDSLIENAIRYSPPGSTITVRAAPGLIEVSDRGPGLSGEERELVFARFHRGSAGRSGPPGTGLGLAIARELAREWGGDVTLVNRAGGGAIATLRLQEHPDGH